MKHALEDDDTSPRATVLRHRTQTHRTRLRADEERHRLRQTWHRLFADAGPDLIVTPAAPTPAIPAGSRSLLVDGAERGFFDQTAWTTLTSHTGLPGLIAPVAHDPNGLPIGVHLTGPASADRLLPAVAEELTQLPALRRPA
ncbi:amidase family protein [Streptomyces antibioticus]|uniref:amidase family protein n=1 Tax=Streptomyces antibioticus TaxID=1890 RepID=UPI0033AA2D09